MEQHSGWSYNLWMEQCSAQAQEKNTPQPVQERLTDGMAHNPGEYFSCCVVRLTPEPWSFGLPTQSPHLLPYDNYPSTQPYNPPHGCKHIQSPPASGAPHCHHEIPSGNGWYKSPDLVMLNLVYHFVVWSPESSPLFFLTTSTILSPHPPYTSTQSLHSQWRLIHLFYSPLCKPKP